MNNEDKFSTIVYGSTLCAKFPRKLTSQFPYKLELLGGHRILCSLYRVLSNRLSGDLVDFAADLAPLIPNISTDPELSVLGYNETDLRAVVASSLGEDLRLLGSKVFELRRLFHGLQTINLAIDASPIFIPLGIQLGFRYVIFHSPYRLHNVLFGLQSFGFRPITSIALSLVFDELVQRYLCEFPDSIVVVDINRNDETHVTEAVEKISTWTSPELFDRDKSTASIKSSLEFYRGSLTHQILSDYDYAMIIRARTTLSKKESANYAESQLNFIQSLGYFKKVNLFIDKENSYANLKQNPIERLLKEYIFYQDLQ
jgi:hypothetical protein